MSLTTQRSKGNSGFSLIEVLAALVVAVVLSAALTRAVGITRANASRIRELVDMMTLSNNLLEQMQAAKLQTGRIDGRSGTLSWHIQVAPATYIVRTLAASADTANTGNASSGTPNGVALSNGSQGREAAASGEAAEEWTAYHIVVVVNTSSGRKYVVDTVKTGRRTAAKQE
jgi:prepilin-type N-terminal cleavage/methylation domain-containing protein